MSIMRSDDQVALQDLHSRVMESVDHYRDSARFIDEERAATLFRRIADDREQLATRVAAAIRDTGDIPSVPDPDRETGEQLIHRLHAWFSTDQTRDVVQQRIEAEQELAGWLATAREECSMNAYRRLCSELEQAIGESRNRLESALGD